MKSYLGIVHANAAECSPWSQKVESSLECRAEAHDLDDSIRAPTLSHLLDSLLHPLLIRHEVEWLGSEAFRELQAGIHAINSENMLRREAACCNDGAEADRAAADYNDDCIGYLLLGHVLEGI